MQVSANGTTSARSLPTPSSAVDEPRPVFVTTHWSVVLSARQKDSPHSAAALETLCRTYWYPLYAYVRRQGHSPHDAQDLTQGFFARLLQKDYLQAAAREKGKFRTFLLVALKRFLANEWDREHAQKRGGFAPVVSIDQEDAESRLAAEPAHNLQPDVLFDRQWARTLLERTMTRLRDEYAATGRARLFELLQGCLAKDESALAYAEIAARLNLTVAAVKMAVRRLRARYREILHAEIADTVASPEEIEEEIRHLFSTFGP
jgi:RNA polymerase sigma factor (sigma-70 family)